jgi:hypothetical protein
MGLSLLQTGYMLQQYCRILIIFRKRGKFIWINKYHIEAKLIGGVAHNILLQNAYT